MMKKNRNVIYTCSLLARFFRDTGFSYTFQRKIIPRLFRPLDSRIEKSRFLIEVFHGIVPRVRRSTPLVGSRPVRLTVPRTNLMNRMRQFWYSNTPGTFLLDGEAISRRNMYVYGGPNSEFRCDTCQKSEWLSRVRQKNMFAIHSCATARRCEELSRRQGDELWTHFHQNFDFALGVDDSLPAPKGLYILFSPKQTFFAPRMEPMERMLRRQFAYSCQLDVVERPQRIDWGRYDFLFIYHTGTNERFSRPSHLPAILFGHDFWPLEHKGYQWVIDWLKPEVLLTSFPSLWEKYFALSKETQIAFHPMFASSFFTRSNLGPKQIDLLAIGNIQGPIFEARRRLSNQISKMPNGYRIEFSHTIGALPPGREDKVEIEDSQNGTPIRYLNKWSEYLGSAKYVTFGRMAWPVLVGKYYEALGSGAIPIIPEIPDLTYLGVKAFEHYIPLSEIEGNNERLRYFLDHYEDYRYIAENAVKWYGERADTSLFEGFEDVIQGLTGNKHPKRLIS